MHILSYCTIKGTKMKLVFGNKTIIWRTYKIKIDKNTEQRIVI